MENTEFTRKEQMQFVFTNLDTLLKLHYGEVLIGRCPIDQFPLIYPAEFDQVFCAQCDNADRDYLVIPARGDTVTT